MDYNTSKLLAINRIIFHVPFVPDDMILILEKLWKKSVKSSTAAFDISLEEIRVKHGIRASYIGKQARCVSAVLRLRIARAQDATSPFALYTLCGIITFAVTPWFSLQQSLWNARFVTLRSGYEVSKTLPFRSLIIQLLERLSLL